MNSKKLPYIYYIPLFFVLFLVSMFNKQNPFCGFYYRFDSVIYQYIGKMMLNGQIPYRDIFDHKGPVVYFWNMLGYFINPVWGQWLIELLLLLISGYLAFNIATKYISPLSSFFITSIIFLCTTNVDAIGNTESLAVVLTFLCFKIFNDFLSNKALTYKQSMTIGFCCAAMLMIKPTYLTTPFVLICTVLCIFIYNKNFKELFLHILYFSIAFLAIILSILLWLYYHNALEDFWYSYISFNFEYIKYWQNSNAKNLALVLFIRDGLVISSFLLMLILVSGCKRLSNNEKIFSLNMIISFVIGFICIILPNTPFFHYLYALYPITFVMAVLCIKLFSKYQKVFNIVLFIIFLFCINKAYPPALECKRESQIPHAANILNFYLDKNDTIQVLGCDMGRIHLLSKRNSATKYVLSGMIERLYPKLLFDAIKAASPKAIVILTKDANIHKQYIKNIWPEFFDKYMLFYYNSEYEIYMPDKS